MRSLIVFVALILAAGAVSAAAPLTPLERQRLLAHMEMTESWLIDEVSGLMPAQLSFRRNANAWTILEVLDHLVVVGPIYWRDLQNARPVSADRAGSMSDIDVLWYGIDRTNKETALRTEEPTRQLKDVGTALAAYRRQHAELVRYIRDST
ncbi:MAG TPA: DinB family protein, partial [Vicinamibacterales bacterium]|nr:DinB family protein [Vicinamibacterales bacterium]